METTVNPFDCVEMQDRAGEKIAEELAGMTVEQQVAYWAGRERELRESRPAVRETWESVLEAVPIPAKTFDAVAMKHAGARRIAEETAGMTREQELAYWRERERELRALQEARDREEPAT
jgi:hypothetical protein